MPTLVHATPPPLRSVARWPWPVVSRGPVRQAPDAGSAPRRQERRDLTCSVRQAPPPRVEGAVESEFDFGVFVTSSEVK